MKTRTQKQNRRPKSKTISDEVGVHRNASFIKDKRDSGCGKAGTSRVELESRVQLESRVERERE